MSKLFEEPEEEEEEAEESEAEPIEAEPAEASLEELLSKRTDVNVVEEDEEETLLDLSRDERTESLTFRAVPKQANEFVCASCFLVKHQSQLADPAKNLCRDCV
ncbi:MAG: DUF4193 family protein [Actinomycetota bacterium]